MTTDNNAMLELAEKLVLYGTKKGATGVEVSVDERNEFRAAVRDGDVETLTEAGSRDVKLRVFVEDKMATASSSDLADTTLSRLVDNAIVRAKLGGADPFAGLPKAEKAKPREIAVQVQ